MSDGSTAFGAALGGALGASLAGQRGRDGHVEYARAPAFYQGGHPLLDGPHNIFFTSVLVARDDGIEYRRANKPRLLVPYADVVDVRCVLGKPKNQIVIETRFHAQPVSATWHSSGAKAGAKAARFCEVVRLLAGIPAPEAPQPA